jgi:glycosyltransferase involved in cell wall biosynthesis
MRVSLIVPAPFATVSGGYAYDRRIVSGLRALGHAVDAVELAGTHPLADDTARVAACAAWDAVPEDSRPVIDGLALPAFDGLDDALAARATTCLVHHPTALETGYDEVQRASLQAMEQRLLRRLTRVIATSETTAERLAADFGVARERISVVTPGTDPAPRSTGSGGTTCHILSIGALVPRKGHDVLLRAVSRLSDLDWSLTIVGSANRDRVHAQTLAALADELGVAQRVRFAGELADDALEALWRDADLFALATHWEGYGMAVAEALKRGVPVAVTSGGAAGALVTPEAGIVLEAADQINLSKGLRRLIYGTTLRRDMAEHAWQLGQTLPDWPAQARLFAEALAL